MTPHAKRRLALLALAAVSGAGCGKDPSPPPPAAATRDGRWVQDIDYLVSELPRLHPNLFFRTTRAEFERAADELRAAVPSLQEHEVVVGLMRLAALPGDGHTALFRWTGFRYLPLELTRLADGLYVTAADDARAALLGARVVAVGERPIGELEAAAATLVSHENEAWLRVQIPQLLAIPEVLHALRATASPAQVTIWADDASGARLRADVPALSSRPALRDLATVAGAPPPLHRQRTAENYWFTVIEASQTLYLQYNRCQQGPEPFGTFADRVFRLLDQNAAARLVVDVRLNGGGNSDVDDPLIRGLRSRAPWRAPGKLFCLIGGATFSSGMWTADDLRQSGAILVGSPTGGKPNSYGDTRSFNLPNSRLLVTYSTKFFRLVDGDPPSVTPELAVEPTVADLRDGRDVVLDAAIAYAGR